MRNIRTLFGPAVAAAMLGGCSHRAPEAPAPENAATTLEVQNDNFNDMRIYVIRGSQRIRLGTANGNMTTSFKIPATVVFGLTSLRFEAVPIGSRAAALSEEITVGQGEQLVLRIPPV